MTDDLINAPTLWQNVKRQSGVRINRFHTSFHACHCCSIIFAIISHIKFLYKILTYNHVLLRNIQTCKLSSYISVHIKQNHWATGLWSLWPSPPRSDQCWLSDNSPLRSPPLCSQWRSLTEAGVDPLYGPLRHAESAILQIIHKTLHSVKLCGESAQLIFQRVKLPVEVSQSIWKRLDPGHMQRHMQRHVRKFTWVNDFSYWMAFQLTLVSLCMSSLETWILFTSKI